MIRAYRPCPRWTWRDYTAVGLMLALFYVRTWREGWPMVLPFIAVAVAWIGSAGL